MMHASADQSDAALEALVAQELKEREARGRREVAALLTAASHRLNGYDVNVLRQWEESGYAGRRPVLSFEMQKQWEKEKQERRREELQERMRARERAAAMEAHRLNCARLLEELQRWREENPLKAEAIDAMQAAIGRERRRLAAAKRAEQERLQLEQERQNQERERQAQLLRRGQDKAGLLAMDEREFLEWCELVDAERLEAFTAELEADAREARKPAWLRGMQELAEAVGLF